MIKNCVCLQKWKKLALQVIINISVLSLPGCAIAKPPGTGWQMTFHDEFNGTTLNTHKWNTCYWWATTGCKLNGDMEIQWYQTDDVITRKGKLRLRAQRRSMNGYNYTAGMVSSHDKYSFKYGYIEMRAKMPKGSGLWPAFWLIPQRRNVWPPELDVMEYLGHDPQGVYMTIHYKTANGKANSGTYWNGPDFSADYHTFAMQWEPDRIVWYIDGVERKRYEVAANIPAEPLYIVANLAVGPAWKNMPPDRTTFPKYYLIDYIRVWQRKSGR
jgi:beta-glucanase (GH16 family)